MVRSAFYALVLLLAATVPPAEAAPEGQMTWAVHTTLVPTWFDPGEVIQQTPFMVLYATHDALVVHRHGVDDPQHSRRRLERGLEHVGVASIAPRRARDRVDGLDREEPAALVVEQPREHRRRVLAPQGAPVDRPVATDQRERPAIADRGVALDRRLHLAHATRRSQPP